MQLVGGWLAVCGVLAVSACSGTGPVGGGQPGSAASPPHGTRGVGTAVPPSSAPTTTPVAPVASAPEPGPGGSGIERIHTGQAEPTLVVVNAYPRGQHVLVDGQHVGTVPSADSASFAVTVGVHTVTCADRADGQGNPSSITETFETGYRYRYEIRTR